MLEDVDIGEFSPGVDEYTGLPAEAVTDTTVVVVASAVQDSATVVIEPADGDEDTEGHHVVIEDGSQITVTVTSEDASRERVYRVRFGEAAEGATTACLRGAVTSVSASWATRAQRRGA